MKKISPVISLSFLVFFLLLFISCERSSTQSSSDWVKYKTDTDGNVCSYKKVNIEKKDGNHLVQVWFKQVYSDKGRKKVIQNMTKNGLYTTGYDKLSEIMVLSEEDCKKEKYVLLSEIEYDTDHKVLSSREIYKPPVWSYVSPGGDELLKEVCK